MSRFRNGNISATIEPINEFDRLPLPNATGRRTASSMNFTPRLNIEDKLLEFTIELYDCQFNYEGSYFCQLTVVNPGATKREMQDVSHWTEASGERVEPGPVASTEPISVLSSLDVGAFRINKFKFVLPRGFYNPEKTEEIYMLIEIFRVEKRLGREQSKKAGECKCPIFPRPPPYDLNARIFEPIYIQNGLLTVFATTERNKTQRSAHRHVGRTRYRCRLREIREVNDVLQSRPLARTGRQSTPRSSRVKPPATYRRPPPVEREPSPTEDEEDIDLDEPEAAQPRQPSPTSDRNALPRPKTPVRSSPTDFHPDEDYPQGLSDQPPAESEREAQPQRLPPSQREEAQSNRRSSPAAPSRLDDEEDDRTAHPYRPEDRRRARERQRREPKAEQRVQPVKDYGYESNVPQLPFGQAAEVAAAENGGALGPTENAWPPPDSGRNNKPVGGAYPVPATKIIAKKKTQVRVNTEQYVSPQGNEQITVAVYAASGVPLKPDGGVPSPYVIL